MPDIRVLLVEDNPGDARLVRELLREAGARVELTLAERLADALRLLDDKPFDVLLLDLSLPDAHGLATVGRVLTNHPSIPIVVLSGERDEALAVEAVQAGAQDYLVKGTGDGALLVRALRYAMERKRSAERLNWLAQHDPLTNLPNRMLLLDRMAQAIEHARRHGEQLAVLFMDLDKFKAINDSLGHEAGDALLKSVAQRLRGCVRREDTVARLAGDEFVILLRGLRAAENAAQVARTVLDALAAPHTLGDEQVTVGASLGIAVEGDSAEELLKKADAALYAVKGQGGTQYAFFEPGLAARVRAHTSQREALHRALEQDQFSLDYQPLVDASDGSVRGMEALVRWDHPERGRLEPGEFLDEVAACGLLAPLGRWVLNKACAEARQWQREGADVCISVNIGAAQASDPSFPGLVESTLRDTGLDGDRLRLELTETAPPVLRALHELGVGVALDNFGCTRLPLATLRELPWDAMSIDRLFIAGMEESPADTEVVSALIRLGHGLRLAVIGKGVESDRQARILREQGCDLVQGYLFGAPMPASDCLPWLRQHASARPGV